MRLFLVALVMALLVGLVHRVDLTAQPNPHLAPPADLAESFRPPPQYRDDFGSFRSPLSFADGTVAKTPEDWRRRRAEILQTWHQAMGPWPALIDSPRVETV